jgi:hypothetical protein
MSIEDQANDAIGRALLQASESLLWKAQNMEPTIVFVAQGPGVEYLWTDATGAARISWYISEEQQSGRRELWDALAHNQVRGHVEPRQMRYTEDNKKP